ncbi:hypothetical protein BH10ACI2_BH10ACI2_04980 [soil metagenome]
MNAKQSMTRKLRAGEHWGSVSNKCHIPSAVFSESTYQQKISLPEHAHELAFFTLILNGIYSEKFAGKDRVFARHTVLWRQADQSHKDRIETDQSQFFFVEIKRIFLDGLNLFERVPDRLVEQNGSLAMLAARLRREIMSGQQYSSLIAEGITLEMLGHLVRKSTEKEKRPPKWLADVVDRLNEEFTESLTTEMLAVEADVHPVHLAAVFRRFYNETIGEYVQKRRVEYCVEMLSRNDMSLIEISQSAGFSDQSHFTRVFKRHTGATPGTFRALSD